MKIIKAMSLPRHIQGILYGSTSSLISAHVTVH